MDNQLYPQWFIHSQTSTEEPFKFGNGCEISVLMTALTTRFDKFPALTVDTFSGGQRELVPLWRHAIVTSQSMAQSRDDLYDVS